METTRLSTKGQIVLPQSIREAKSWGPGTEFTIEETTDGILLRPTSPFAKTRLEDVVGCLHVPGRKPATLAEMDRSIAREVKRRHDLGRY